MRETVLSRCTAMLGFCLLLATATFPKMSLANVDSANLLAHRWSFNGSYNDSVTSENATVIGTNVSISASGKSVVMSGASHGSGSLLLGRGSLPADGRSATIEIWGMANGTNRYARIFDYGYDNRNYFTMSWNMAGNIAIDCVQARLDNVQVLVSNGTMSPYDLGTAYHISVVFKNNGDGSTTVRWARRNAATGALEKSGTQTLTNWDVSLLAGSQFYLGRCLFIADIDAKAEYDEVRVWNAALTDAQLAANAAAGPDTVPQTVEVEGAAVSTALWTGAADDGNLANAANWECRDDTGSIIQNGLPDATMNAVFTGDVSLQIPTGTTFSCSAVYFDNVRLTVDCDWRGLDASIPFNGRLDLSGRRFQRTSLGGRAIITSNSGALLNGGFERGGNGLEGWTVSGSVSAMNNDNQYLWRSGNGSTWCYIPRNGSISQDFSLEEDTECVLSFKHCMVTKKTYPEDPSSGHYYYWYGSLSVKIDGSEAFNIVNTNFVQTQTLKLNLTGGQHTFQLSATGQTVVDDIYLGKRSNLEIDVPEGRTVENLETLILGGANTLVTKAGKGKLVMTRANSGFGAGGRRSGNVSMIVKDGVVRQCSTVASSPIYSCGAAYSTIIVENGGQFDVAGRQNHDYDYRIAGTGPDGTGALVNTQYVSSPYDPGTNYRGFIQDVILDDDATIGGNQVWGLFHYNYGANTLTLNGHILTFAGTTFYGGNMSILDEGTVVIAPGAVLEHYRTSPSAVNCNLVVQGVLQQHGCALTPVRSLCFTSEGSFNNSYSSRPVITVLERYAPNLKSEQTSVVAHPTVQLGNAGNLATTLDLSLFSDAFSTESTTFYSGSTVAVDIGTREPESGARLVSWTSQPESVTFTLAGQCADEGTADIIIASDGIYFNKKSTPQTSHTVTFNLGGHGIRTGGGELSQTVMYGHAAIAPVVTPDADYTFIGWDGDHSNITNEAAFTAVYVAKSGAVLWDASAYAQNGLVAHFDGIRNAGAGELHSMSVRKWKNLVSSSPDALFDTDEGHWTDNGFYFNGNVLAQLKSTGIALGDYPTIQLACDIDWTQQKSGSGVYPCLFCDPMSDTLSIYFNNTQGNPTSNLLFKVDTYTGQGGAATRSQFVWAGDYVTGMLSENETYLFGGTEPANPMPRTATKSIPSIAFSWGGSRVGVAYTNRYVKGLYHSVRMYNRNLTEAELARNRRVDDIRYRYVGADVVIATAASGCQGNEPCGVYTVNGSRVFAAPVSNVVDGCAMMCSGYTLDAWDAVQRTWTNISESASREFTYVKGSTPAPVRLTWQWETTANEPSVTSLEIAQTGDGRNIDVTIAVSCDDPMQGNYVYFVARDEATGMEYPMRSVTGLDGHAASTYTNGTYRFRWNAIADLPSGVAGGIRVHAFVSRHALAHRWGFNGSYSDTVGAMDAAAVGDVALSGGAATLAGGVSGTSYVALGQEVFPVHDQPRTIEIWGRQNAVQKWSRIFDFGTSTTDFMTMTFTAPDDINRDAVRIYDMNGNIYDAMAPYAIGVDYHIAMTLNPLGGNVWDVRCYKQHDVTGATLAKNAFRLSNALSLTNLTQKTLYLGHSFFVADNDASATYSEVRIWNAALSEAELTRNALAGRDAVSGLASMASEAISFVTFDLGEHGTRAGGGEMVQVVVKGSAAVAPEVAPANGWRLAGWDADFSAVTSDVTVTAVYERFIPADWYVDSVNGSDSNDGRDVEAPFRTIQSAIDHADNGDVVSVKPGVYAPIATSGKSVEIIGLYGASNTVIDASLSWVDGVTNRCATLGTTTNAVLRGFTLVNGRVDGGYGGGAYYGTLEDCVISNCTARYGGGTGYCSLRRCIVKSNTATTYGGGTYYGTTESTLIVHNSTPNLGGGTYYGTHINATVTDNTAGIAPGGCYCGTLRSSISYANTASSGSSSYYNVTNATCEYSCVYPSQSGTGNISSNPKFVNSGAGDYSLQTSSPCINTGWNYLVPDAMDIVCNARTRGSRTDMGAYELQQGAEYTGNRTLYVSASNGSDSNDGLAWETAFKTLQAAVTASFAGDRIMVTNGTYSSITSLGKALRIESVEGAAATIINGNNSTRCATLGTSTSDKATKLIGFTLQNGYASSANGGGALYGTLEDCIISGCSAYRYSSGQYGGGTYYTDATRCVYTGCSASYGYGGAAYYGKLTDCTFNNNSAYYGGGTYYGTVSNCVYVNNRATYYYGGGAYYGTLYDCVVTNNTSSQYGGGTYGATLYRCLLSGNKSSSSYGGGACNGTLHECVVSNNTASTLGGGTYGSTMYNCLVVRNSTTGSSSSGGGVQGGTAYNCTITGNSAPYRGGMQGGVAYGCIIWGNTETKQTSNYANVSNTACHATCTLPLQSNDEYNISTDPMFADVAAGDYHLQAGSPCIDAALNTQSADAVDLDGNARVKNRRADMGAYELQQSSELDGKAVTWYVDGTAGDDGNTGMASESPAKTIGKVLLNAAAGDEVIVAPGVYSPINTYGVAMTIRSTGGPDVTIIDASPELNGGVTNRCATLAMTSSMSQSGTRLVGFTLRNGTGVPTPTGTSGSYGGGSFGGVLEDCILTNNVATTGGGAYYGYLSGCRVVGNSAVSIGGGTCAATLNRCLVTDNTARAGGGCANGAYLNTIIARNTASQYGGGIYGVPSGNSFISSTPYIFFTTITENTAGTSGGGCYTNMRAYNSIIWGNTSSSGANYVNTGSSATSSISYGSCTTPRPQRGEGNIVADPYLRLWIDGTYRIAQGSPCIDTGNNSVVSYATRYFSISDLDVDYLGNERRQGAQYDIGAIEGYVEMVVPDRVEGVTASDSLAADGITVTWEGASLAQNYRIYRADSNSVDGAALLATVTTTRYYDTNTVAGVTYWYFIQAVNFVGAAEMSAGDSGWRVPKLVITTTELPEAEAGSEYTAGMSGEGGREPYTWTFVPIDGYYMTRQANSYSSSSGSSAGVSGDDTCSSYTLPFTFIYYGKQYNTVWINSNGTLNFDGTFSTYSASAGSLSNRVMIAAMWKDLNTSSGGVYVNQPNSDCVRFRWSGVYYNTSSQVNFSVTLYRDGRIVISHGNGNANGGFVGVSSGVGDAVYQNVSSSLSYANDYVFGPLGTMDWASFTDGGTISGKPLEPVTNNFHVTLTDALGNRITETRSVRVYASANLHPVVSGFSPAKDRVVTLPDNDTRFAFDAADPDGGELTYIWLVDGVTNQVGTSSEFIYRPEETFGGEHTLSCIISDGYWFDISKKTWTLVVPKWYVSPEGSDGNSGASFATAFSSLQKAVNSAAAGDVVYVKTGAYGSVSTSNKGIQILAAKGATPVIDGQNGSRCVYVGNGSSNTNTLFRGFVIRNGFASGSYGGGASGGTFENCVFEQCRAGSNGGGAYYANLFNCRLTGNSAANGGGAYGGTLRNCQVDENTADAGGGTYSANLYNCTVTRNTGTTCGGVYGGNVYNSVVWDNKLRDCIQLSNVASLSSIQYSCTSPAQSGTGNRSDDPLLAVGADGIFRLYSGSPCVDAGSNSYASGASDLLGNARIDGNAVDMGSAEGALTGNYVKIVTSGPGRASASVVVPDGNAATVVAEQLDAHHSFLGFLCDGTNLAGVVSSGLSHRAEFVPTNAVTEITAAFETRTFYVSPDGDDAADARTWDTAVRTLQVAIDRTTTGDRVLVADGVYAPVSTSDKQIQVISENGHTKAIIDGGGTNRCVYAGDGGSYTRTAFHGFTIRNGRANNGYGAGARGGTFYNCVFQNNVQTGSSYAGGATSGSNLNNCLLVGNSAYNGGGANSGTLVNCTIVGNTASYRGGGVYNGTVRNSIVWDNTSPNSYSNYYSASFTYSCTAPSASGTGNISTYPYFTDPTGGDYRLRQYSPCLDVGNNSYAVGEFDLLGTNRVIDATVDLGAYEGWVYLPVPSAVQGLSAADGTRIGLVRLTWTAEEYSRTYKVYRSATESFAEFEVLGTTASCFFDDETAQPETTYWYRVAGVNPAGEGETCAADSGWCLGEMVFGANELQTATAGLAYSAQLAITGGSGSYTWKAGADDYDVVYGESTYLAGSSDSTGVASDDSCLAYPLPFDFPFFGKSYNKVWVSSNGTLSFDGSMTDHSSSLDFFKSRVMIAVLWKDLVPGSGGVGVCTNGTESITFLWNGARYHSGGAAVNASATLYADGTILCSYGAGNASGGFVGVSAGDGVHYHDYNLMGTSLENADDIRFNPQDVPGGLTLSADGTLSGVAAAPGTYVFTVFVTDSYGNGATQKVTLEVEENPDMRTVQFDLGEHGVRGGGGTLLQYVLLGGDATPPSVRAKTGWLFDGWIGSYTQIVDNAVVTAQYRSTYADLQVSAISMPAEVMSGSDVEIRWTVANTGNPQFNGTMTEKVTLVSAADDSVTIDVAAPAFNGIVPRNESVERSATVSIPLKGWVGTWKVRVETAIRPSFIEFAENNVTTSTSTMEVKTSPLPDLSVKTVSLDRNPADYMPLDTVTVRYVVQNTGTGAATAPWRDRLYLCKDGSKVTLATLEETENLAAGSEVERTIQCVIPELIALSGDVSFAVKADCDDAVVEIADDDTLEDAVWETTPNATLGKRLYLTFASASVNENNSSGVRFYAKRSGETSKSLVLAVTASGATSEVTYPGEITIAAGSSTATGYIKPIDNGIVDGSRRVTFTLVPPVGSGFDQTASTLTIVDNEVPKLTLAFDKDSIKEGDGVIVVTVTRQLVTDEPLTVYLNGVAASHCSYPSSVEIPAGEASVTFELVPVNNDAAEIAAALTLRASANGYTAATQGFTVEDDDVPSVTLTLYPEEVSEGAGPNAAYAILSRVNEDNIGSAITVNLTPSIANQLILQSSVTIPAYTMAVRFPIGTVDNADDEGDRDITITGSIYIPSCGCSGQPSSGDVIEAMIRIIDNDTPALSLTADPSTMKEGLNHAGDLILSHNSALTEDLVVTLSFDTTGEIEIPATVTIPAGETSVTIPVKTIDDGETDGGKLVSVYADDESGEFKSASTWIQVSDQNLPDLKVSGIFTPSSVYAGKAIDINFTVSNEGFTDSTGDIEYSIHLIPGTGNGMGTDGNKIASGKVQGGVVVGDSFDVSCTAKAPSGTGSYRVLVVIDSADKVVELDDSNNSSYSSTITVTAAYTASVQAEKDVYVQGETVLLTGTAVYPDGVTPAANLPVSVYVSHNGYQRLLAVETDGNGAFSTQFAPENGESGDYSVAAFYPGVVSNASQDEFDILGMERTSSGYLTWNNMVVGTESSKTVNIRNTSSTPLTGIAVVSQNVPETCAVEYSIADTLPGNGTIRLTINMKSLGVSSNVKTSSGYEEMYLYVTSSEGVALKIPLYFYGMSPRALVKANPASIVSTMVKDATRYIAFTLTNEGQAESGAVSVELPQCSWMQVVAGSRFESLASGESGTVTLAVTPIDDAMVLNAQYKGSIAIHCENGPGTTLPFNFTLVSEYKGGIRVDVTDALTLTAENSPHVSGASVTIYNAAGTVVATGSTNGQGIFEVDELLEGKYTVRVSANQHSPKSAEVNVIPGVVNSAMVYLDYEAVSYDWKVVPTEVEDQYTIELMLDYETNVPYPVMEIHVPDEIPQLEEGEQYVVGVVVENKGLVAIENVRLQLNGSIGNYTFEQLSPNVERLAALSSATIYVRFTNPTRTAPRSIRLAAGIEDYTPEFQQAFPCTFGLYALGHALCGDEGIDLIQKSKNIRVLGAMCDIMMAIINNLNLGGGQTGPSDPGQPTRPKPGPDKDPDPDIRNPYVSEQRADCACLINALDKFLGWTLFRTFPAGEIYDFVESTDTMFRSKSPCEFFLNASKVKVPDFKSAAKGLNLQRLLDDALDVYKKCRDSMGHNAVLDFASEANDVYKRLKKYADAFKKLSDSFDSILNDEKWEVGDNAAYLFAYLGQKLQSDTPTIEEAEEEFLGMADDLDEITSADLETFRGRWNACAPTLKAMCESALHNNDNGATSNTPPRLAASGASQARLLAGNEGVSNAIDVELLADALATFAELREEMAADGYSSLNEMFAAYATKLERMIKDADAAQLCAKITLKLSQSVTMTREAFEGTLTVNNGNLNTRLSNVTLDLQVMDADGNVHNNFFGITDNGISGFSGSSIMDGSAALAANSSGEAKVLFVPTVNAAPEVPVVYYFGGTLSYFDESLQTIVRTKLSPVPLQVNPCPYLQFDYFIQRDVYADDPFTADIVEASMPAEFAVLIRNVGYGDAKNVTISSAQPQVIVNEKGLAIDFSLKDYIVDATALNGATAYLGLSDVNLGTVSAHSNVVAQWWFTSTLEGHFSGMSATMTHLNSWGNPDTSLIGEVKTHKLVRSITADADGLPDFLVSEDFFGAPTSLYFSNGEIEPVHRASMSINGELGGTEVVLRITARSVSEGWNYAELVVDNAFLYKVKSLCLGDNDVDVRRAWITDRTFRDGLPNLSQELIHFVFHANEVCEQEFVLTLEAKPSDIPEVESFANVNDNAIEHVARDSVVVVFNKVIDGTSFEVSDIQLIRQGEYVNNLSSLSIAPVGQDGKTFAISGLSEYCNAYGSYRLIVQCAGISDIGGQLGAFGKGVKWTLSPADSPYILDAEGRPTKRVRRLNGVTTVTSIPVTEESARNLVVTLNGTDVSQFVTIRSADDTGTRFAIEGLEDLQLFDGDYTLVIYGGNLVGVDGGTGVESYTVTWTRDTTAPVLNGVRREVGLDGTSFVLELTEDVDPATISLSNVRLTRSSTRRLGAGRPRLLGDAPAGETEIALPATARLTPLGNGEYTVRGVDSVILEDGTYTLYFDATGVADEAGNEVVGTKSVSWTVDKTAPEAVSDIMVSSEYGSVETGVYTATRELTIGGTVPESGLTVKVFAKYVGGEETLLAEPEVDGSLKFSADVTLPGDGNLTIIIRLTDAYGNSSDTEFSVYVDAIPLGAEISGMPQPDVAAETLTITFLNGTPDEATALSAAMSLTLDGTAMPIPNVTISKTEDRVYTVSGLSAYTAGYGTYVFSYDVSQVKKATSGMTGETLAVATWVNYPLDTTAPTIAEMKFDGEAPLPAYVANQMFSEISVRFSEAVNVPEIIAAGLEGQAFSIQFLSEANNVVGTLNAENVTWNTSTFTATWTFDGLAVPCGKARVVVDSSLIKDASGNGLAATDAYDVISGAKTYTPSLLKRGVAYSYACPTLHDWNNDGLLDLIVGEKTADAKGKVRIYLNRGTATEPVFDDYTYLQRDGEDVEFQAQGCVGVQVSFGRFSSATMILATSQGEIYGWRHRAKNPKTNESLPMTLWFDHSTDSRFSSLQRTHTFCCDIDGNGTKDVLVSGQNSPMFWMKRTIVNDVAVTECTPIMDADGANLQFPEGQNHTSAIMADVSGDAVRDLVTGDTAGNVWVYYGLGNARFSSTPIKIYENPETSNKRSRLALGDIDGDGVEDMLVGRQDGSVLLLKGSAVLAPAVNFKCVEIKSVEEALNDDIFWVDGAAGWVCEQFGEEAQATVTHTEDSETTVLTAKFTGAGTVTFTWAVNGSNASSVFKCTGADSEIVKTGPFTQVAQAVTISSPGMHEVSWVFSGRNTAIIRDVAFTPADPALQVTQTTAVPIPFADINRYANAIWKANGGDYEAAAKAVAANGKTVMDNCIAGLDCSDGLAAFLAKITCEDDKVKISWIPALNGEIDNEGIATGIRIYKVYGKEDIRTGEWTLVTPENKARMKFFKVTVEMP